MGKATPTECPICHVYEPSKMALHRHLREDHRDSEVTTEKVSIFIDEPLPIEPDPETLPAGDASSAIDPAWLDLFRHEMPEALVSIRDALDAELDRKVTALLRSGYWTYADAGRAIGVTKQRAHQLYGPKGTK